MSGFRRLLASLVLAMVAIVAIPAPGAAVTITEFSVASGSFPTHVATGFDFVWATAENGNSIIRLNSETGSFVVFPIPFAPPGETTSTPCGIVAGFDAVWFTLRAGKLGRLDPTSGRITLFDVPGGADIVHPDVGFGSVWFAVVFDSQAGISPSSRIGRFTPDTNTFTFYTTPTLESGPREVAAGLGAVWFTEDFGNKIGRLDPLTGAFTEFPVPTPQARPWGVTVAFGAVWFAELFGGKIGRLDPVTGVITEFPAPNPNAGFGFGFLTAGGPFIWYTRSLTRTIGRLNPNTRTIVEFALPTPGAKDFSLHGITFGLGDVWFADGNADQIGKVPIG